MYLVPRWSNVSLTHGFASVRSLRRLSGSLLEPLVFPNRAYVMASKIIVFPDPVFPVIRNSPEPILSKSTVVGWEYGPKASISRRTGLIPRHLPRRCSP